VTGDVVVAPTRDHSCLPEGNPSRSVHMIPNFSCNFNLTWCPCVSVTVLANLTIDIWETGRGNSRSWSRGGGNSCGCEVRSSRWRASTPLKWRMMWEEGSCGASGVVLTLVRGLGIRNVRNILACNNNQLVNILTLPVFRKWILIPNIGEFYHQIIDELGADFILRIRDAVT